MRDLIGIPSWTAGLALALVVLLWSLLSYANKLRLEKIPKVRIRYENEPKFRKEVIVEDEFQRYRGISIRPTVEACADSTAERCIPYLTKSERKNEQGLFEEIPPYEPLKLEWAVQGGFDPADIAKHIPRYFGTASSQENNDYFQIKSRPISIVHPPKFAQHGEYRFTIAVSGANIATSVARLIVTWNGKWNEIEAHLDAT